MRPEILFESRERKVVEGLELLVGELDRGNLRLVGRGLLDARVDQVGGGNESDQQHRDREHHLEQPHSILGLRMDPPR